MTYVAFLRAVNVGGKSIVSMAAIKEALVTLGRTDLHQLGKLHLLDPGIGRSAAHGPDREGAITIRSANTMRKLNELTAVR